MPVRHNATDSGRKNRVKVAEDVHRVTASKLHIRREAKVFANHHLVADANGSRKGLVVCVAKTKHQLAIIAFDAFSLQGEPSEVAEAVTRKRVFLLSDLKTSGRNDIASAISEKCVRNWSVCVRSGRSRHLGQLLGLDFVFSEYQHARTIPQI